MDDFGEFNDFNEYDVQGRPIKIHKNGEFIDNKILFVQQHWSWDEFLCAATQRLEMVPKAQRVFNADGAEIDDIMCIEDDDMLFFSSGDPFAAPQLNEEEESGEADASGAEKPKGEFSGVVGGYKIGAFLGRGGFGEVRTGVHQITGEQVALKFILKSEMGSLGDVERTTTEIQCLTALNHPSIIKLLRVMNEPDHMVLGIELLEGGDLLHHLRELPPGGLSESESVSLFKQIVAGVGYAHNQHICHRDLKLENILLANVNDLSVVKIADFGLSDFYRPGAVMKTNCGSISYLAPEVFRGTCNAGPPLDVWSLGVILFAIYAGRLPFEGPDLKGTNRPRENVIRNRILNGQYKIDNGVSTELRDLMERMLESDPNERATIPEIFNHPWIHGVNTILKSEDLGAECDLPMDGETESLPSSNLESAKAGTHDAASDYSMLGSFPTDEENLPAAAQRSPARNSSMRVAPVVTPLQGSPNRQRPRPGAERQSPRVASLDRTTSKTNSKTSRLREDSKKRMPTASPDKVASHREANLPADDKNGRSRRTNGLSDKSKVQSPIGSDNHDSAAAKLSPEKRTLSQAGGRRRRD